MINSYIKLVNACLILICTVIISGCITTSPTKNAGWQVNINVVDEFDGSISDATVNIGSENDNRTMYKTNSVGSVTIYNISKFPFTLEVYKDESYHLVRRVIEREDIDSEPSARQIHILLERKKTTITGIVVDIDTGEALPISAGPITITTEPPSDIIQADRTGAYEIGSTDFEEGVFIAVRAQLPGKYEESTELAEINNYWGRNKVPTLGLKKLPGWEPPVLSDDSIKVIDQPPTGPAVIE